jgi:recombination protein RecT
VSDNIAQTLPAQQQPGTTLGKLISANHKAIASVLPKHLTPDRLARLALSEVNRNPGLAKADAASFIGALIQSAQLGLEPGAAGLGYLIPRFNKNTNKTEVQFQAGYKGLMMLARNSGEVGSIMAEVVCEGDEFSYMLGTAPHLRHKPATSGRGKVTHIYAVAHLFKSDDWQFSVMTTEEVDNVKARSGAQGFSPWKTDWDEMAKKTVIRRLCKYLPMSVEVMSHLGREEAAEAGVGPGSVAFVPEGMVDLPKERPTSLGGRMAAAQDADFEPVSAGGDDWDLMEGPELYAALEPLVASRMKWKRALADLSARADVPGMRALAREVATASGGVS